MINDVFWMDSTVFSYALAPLFMMAVGLIIYCIFSHIFSGFLPSWSKYDKSNWFKLALVRIFTYVIIIAIALLCGVGVGAILSVVPFSVFSIFLAILITIAPGATSIIILILGMSIDKIVLNKIKSLEESNVIES